ncbi:MAG: aminopeptidase [Janthinobacterium sp.]|jgi:aminopeptidase
MTLLPTTQHNLRDDLLALAEKNVRDLLSLAIKYAPPQSALVVFDTRCELGDLLTEAYRRAIPDALLIDFATVSPDDVLAAFATLAPHDLVVLIQPTSFRLEAFRIRIELFKRELKVIEHVHLARMTGLEARYYIEALAYDPSYYRGVGLALKARIDRAGSAMLDSGGARLIFSGALEAAKLNIGDYTGMKNIGGQFPIGEVFTEAQDLEAVNGRVRIFVFGDTAFMVNRPLTPITLVIERGRVTEVIDSTPEFDVVLAAIRADEGQVWLRELGFGMNRALSPTQMVGDIGTFERMCGIHLSLGAKHGVYQKPQFKRKDARYHVDVFAVTEGVYLDDERVYRDGNWIV